MGRVTSYLSISLDGYAAGPDQTAAEPLGKGGERLHEWALATRSWQEHHGHEGGEASTDSAIVEQQTANVGAYIMGRNMFGPTPDAPDPQWRGWWGDTPPFHAPVFVLTHQHREALTMQGGTVFHFVTAGPEHALELAKAAAGDQDVCVAGGAQTIQQFLAAGLLDELLLHIAPVILGGGERLFENVGDPRLTPIEAFGSQAVTHVRYRVGPA